MTYYEGHRDAVRALKTMTNEELLEVLDGLHGRDNILDETDRGELLYEARLQVDHDFTIPDTIDQDTFLAAAMKNT